MRAVYDLDLKFDCLTRENSRECGLIKAEQLEHLEGSLQHWLHLLRTSFGGAPVAAQEPVSGTELKLDGL